METLLKTKTAAPGEKDFGGESRISFFDNFRSEIDLGEKIAPVNPGRLTPAEEPYENVTNERLTYIHETTVSALDEDDTEDDDDFDDDDDLDEVDLDEDDTEELDEADLDDDDLDLDIDEDDEDEDEDAI